MTNTTSTASQPRSSISCRVIGSGGPGLSAWHASGAVSGLLAEDRQQRREFELATVDVMSVSNAIAGLADSQLILACRAEAGYARRRANICRERPPCRSAASPTRLRPPERHGGRSLQIRGTYTSVQSEPDSLANPERIGRPYVI